MPSLVLGRMPGGRRGEGADDRVRVGLVAVQSGLEQGPEEERVAGADGFRAALRYEGTDTLSLIALVAAGHGLTLLPAPVVAAGELTAVPVAEPRIVHRVELVHGTLREGSPAAALASSL